MVLDIFITLFLVVLNGFFVAAEFAIVKVRLSQIEIKAKAGSRTAKLSAHIVSHLDGYLAATQLGITLASLGLGWVGEPVVSKIILNTMGAVGITINPELAHQIALPVAFAIITVLHIVFGELAPKSMAIQRAETVTLLIAYPLNAFYWICRPFIWLLNGFANVVLKLFGIHAVHGSEVHSSDELKYIIKQSSEGGEIETVDYDIIKNAFDFSQRTVKQVLIPRSQVVALDIENCNDAAIEKILDEGYSRIPCYENDVDNVVGIVYVKDILARLKKNEEIQIKALIRPVIIIPENKKIGSLLKEFQQRHIHLAVVVNEFGGTKGIVTMEDIIEELVGQIQDEYDNEVAVVEQVSAGVFKVVSTTAIKDINHFLPHPISIAGEFDTLAGALIEHFGKIPNINEKIIFDNYEITVLKRIKNTIGLVQLRNLEE